MPTIFIIYDTNYLVSQSEPYQLINSQRQSVGGQSALLTAPPNHEIIHTIPRPVRDEVMQAVSDDQKNDKKRRKSTTALMDLIMKMDAYRDPDELRAMMSAGSLDFGNYMDRKVTPLVVDAVARWRENIAYVASTSPKTVHDVKRLNTEKVLNTFCTETEKDLSELLKERWEAYRERQRKLEHRNRVSRQRAILGGTAMAFVFAGIIAFFGFQQEAIGAFCALVVLALMAFLPRLPRVPEQHSEFSSPLLPDSELEFETGMEPEPQADSDSKAETT